MPTHPIEGDTMTIALPEVDTIFGRIRAFPGDLITEQLVSFGAHTRPELAFLLNMVDEGDGVFDLGAHIGTFALPIARKVGPQGRVLAVEGDLRTWQVLQHNIAGLGLSGVVSARNVLLGGAGAQYRVENMAGNTGANFVAPVAEGGALATTLDELVASHFLPRVVKIDIEGMELVTLGSAPRLLGGRPVLYIEIAKGNMERYGSSVEGMDTLLRGLGYRFFRNVGDRNGAHDRFVPQELETVMAGGEFYDLMAVHASDPRLGRILARLPGAARPDAVAPAAPAASAAAPHGRLAGRSVAELLPAFAFWDGEDTAPLQDFSQVCAGLFPGFRVYGTRQVAALFEQHFPDFAEIFTRIRIPAARADLARLMLLYDRGGFYIDCHYGIRRPEAVPAFFDALLRHELVVFDRLPEAGPKRPDEMILCNGLILARPGSALILDCLRQAMANVEWLDRRLRMNLATEYDIWKLTGPGLLTEMLMQPGSQGRQVRRGCEDRILVVPEEGSPFVRGQQRRYPGLGSGQHWSERQRHEPLLSAPVAATGAVSPAVAPAATAVTGGFHYL